MMPKRISALIVVFCFCLEQTGFAQVAGQLDMSPLLAGVPRSAAATFRPVHLRSVSYDARNEGLDMLLDKGSAGEAAREKTIDSCRNLLNYFLTGVSLPGNIFWVNLRPDSPLKMIDMLLKKTDAGRILLEADLQLKKDTASYTSPKTIEGREYWDKLYKRAEELFGAGDVSIPTLTRPWIVPDEIIIRESGNSAYIYKATLKVLLEQDYLKDTSFYNFHDQRLKQLNEYASQLIRELIIPRITREVNSAKRYAPLRQVYYSLILAQWFKDRYRASAGKYARRIDTRDLSDIPARDVNADAYFQAYKKSFSEGEYNIRENIARGGKQKIRQYFSGGVMLDLGAGAGSAGGASRTVIRAERDGGDIFGRIPAYIRARADGDGGINVAEGSRNSMPDWLSQELENRSRTSGVKVSDGIKRTDADGKEITLGTAGFRVTDRDKDREYGRRGGWKIHLTMDPARHRQVDEWLFNNHKGQYKLGMGGATGEKDFTVYAGSWSDATALADKIETELGSILNVPDVDDDRYVTPHVAARYDIARTKQGPAGIEYYGMGGVPRDKTAAENSLYGNSLELQMRDLRRIDALLLKERGEHYRPSAIPFDQWFNIASPREITLPARNTAPSPEAMPDWLVQAIADRDTKDGGQVWSARNQKLLFDRNVLLGFQREDGRIQPRFDWLEYRRENNSPRQMAWLSPLQETLRAEAVRIIGGMAATGETSSVFILQDTRNDEIVEFHVSLQGDIALVAEARTFSSPRTQWDGGSGFTLRQITQAFSSAVDKKTDAARKDGGAGRFDSVGSSKDAPAASHGNYFTFYKAISGDYKTLERSDEHGNLGKWFTTNEERDSAEIREIMRRPGNSKGIYLGVAYHGGELSRAAQADFRKTVILDVNPFVGELFIPVRNALLGLSGSRAEYLGLLSSVRFTSFELAGLKDAPLAGIYAVLQDKLRLAEPQERERVCETTWELIAGRFKDQGLAEKAQDFWRHYSETDRRSPNPFNVLRMVLRMDEPASWLSDEAHFQKVKAMAEKDRILGISGDWTDERLFKSSFIPALLQGNDTVSVIYISNIFEWWSNAPDRREKNNALIANIRALPLAPDSVLIFNSMGRNMIIRDVGKFTEDGRLLEAIHDAMGRRTSSHRAGVNEGPGIIDAEEDNGKDGGRIIDTVGIDFGVIRLKDEAGQEVGSMRLYEGAGNRIIRLTVAGNNQWQKVDEALRIAAGIASIRDVPGDRARIAALLSAHTPFDPAVWNRSLVIVNGTRAVSLNERGWVLGAIMDTEAQRRLAYVFKASYEHRNRHPYQYGNALDRTIEHFKRLEKGIIDRDAGQREIFDFETDGGTLAGSVYSAGDDIVIEDQGGRQVIRMRLFDAQGKRIVRLNVSGPDKWKKIDEALRISAGTTSMGDFSGDKEQGRRKAAQLLAAYKTFDPGIWGRAMVVAQGTDTTEVVSLTNELWVQAANLSAAERQAVSRLPEMSTQRPYIYNFAFNELYERLKNIERIRVEQVAPEKSVYDLTSPRGTAMRVLVGTMVPDTCDVKAKLADYTSLLEIPESSVTVSGPLPVPVSGLRCTQANIRMDELAERLADSPDVPVIVYRVDDAYYIADGHHRAAGAWLRGENTVNAYVWEFDSMAMRLIRNLNSVRAKPTRIYELPVMVNKSEMPLSRMDFRGVEHYPTKRAVVFELLPQSSFYREHQGARDPAGKDGGVGQVLALDAQGVRALLGQALLGDLQKRETLQEIYRRSLRPKETAALNPALGIRVEHRVNPRTGNPSVTVYGSLENEPDLFSFKFLMFRNGEGYDGKTIELNEVFVHSALRNKGVGTRLIVKCLEFFLAAGFETVSVTPQGAVGLAYWRGVGITPTHRRVAVRSLIERIAEKTGTQGAGGAAAESDKKGGIDLRSLPITRQNMASTDLFTDKASVSAMDLEAEWTRIGRMVAAGLRPSGKRIGEFVAACRIKGRGGRYGDDVLIWIAGMMRIEEESAVQTEKELKDILFLLESAG